MSDAAPVPNIRDLLGIRPLSSKLSHLLVALSANQDAPDVVPEVKSYPDAIYFNYYPLGLSLVFSPTDGYKPSAGLDMQSLKQEKLVLDSIDIYNVPKSSTTSAPQSKPPSKSTTPNYSAYPLMPLTLTFSNETSDGDVGPPKLDVVPETNGKQFVECLGEPDRKGGGAGPSSGSIGIWCEWLKHGIMVEFGGDEARGPKAWETGKDAVWKVITIFQPKL